MRQIPVAAVVISAFLDLPVSAQDAVPAPEPQSRAPVLTNAPDVVAALKKHYPRVLRHQGISGRPILQVAVDAAGKVAKVDVEYAGGHSLFAAAARKVASEMRFAPALRAGEPVPMTISVPVRFLVELPPELTNLEICQTPPELINRHKVEELLTRYYPPRLAGVGGMVVLDMTVDRRGRVWNIEVAEPSSKSDLDEVALSLGSLMEFKPGTQDGKPVPSRVRVPVVFKR